MIRVAPKEMGDLSIWIEQAPVRIPKESVNSFKTLW